MRKYPVKSNDGNIYYASHIGVNYTNGWHSGGIASSYSEKFDNLDEVNIENGIGDIRHCTIGDIKEAYEILKNVIKEERPKTFMEYAYCIQQTVLKYFGDYSNIGERLSFFPDDEEVYYYKRECGRVSDIAHKNAAMCVERAMLAQNLLKELGFDSTFKLSAFKNNGKDDAHAYNIVRADDKNYLFDVTIPTTRDDRISPVICEIPDEVYEKITNPSSYIGESVHVVHYNPLQDKEYDVIYDAGRKDVYEVQESYTK